MLDLVKGLPAELVLAAAYIALIAFVVLVAALVWAVLQGREVTLWPPKIGGETQTSIGNASGSARVPAAEQAVWQIPGDSSNPTELPVVEISARPIAQIYVKDGHSPDRNYVVTANHRHLSVGRIPGNDIVLNIASVSRIHFRIFIEPAPAESGERRRYQFILADAGSSSGTFVNGERITRSTLPAKAYIQAGAAELEFYNQT